MKKYYLLLSFFIFYFLFLNSTFCQNKSLFDSQTNSELALIYKFKDFDTKIGSSAVYDILEKDTNELENHLVLVDSIFLKDQPRYSNESRLNISPTSDYGYYLIVWTEEEILKTKLITVAPLHVVVQNNARRSWLVIYDSLGNELPNLKVNLILETENGKYSKQKAISYNSKLKHYELPNKKSYSKVEIEYAGKKWFLYAEREDKETYHRRRPPFYKKVIYRFPVKYFWIVPYRQGKKIVETIQYGEPNDLRLIRFFTKIFKKKEEQKNNHYYFNGMHRAGYFLTDKIKYRPYDTLRFKGYFVKRKGKPIKRKEIDVFISSNTSKHKKVATIKRYRKGGFEGQVILTDSLDLRLGQFAGISLRIKNGRKKNEVLVAEKFDYQDYLLPDIKTFDVKLSATKQYKDTPFSIRLSAKDFNNLAVLDGKIEILIENEEFQTTYKPSLKESDYKTIWKHNQKLEPFGETVIVVPDSIFPAADLSYKLTTKLSNSNNETKKEIRNMDYDYFTKTPIIKTRFEDGFVYAIYKEGNDTIPKKALLTRIYETNADDYNLNEIHRKDSITLPFKERVNPTYTKYYFQVSTKLYNEEIEINSTEYIPNDIEINGKYTFDSLIMTINNPYKANIRYSLFQKNKLIQQKADSSSIIRIAIKDKNKKVYILQTSYTYSAEVLQEEKAFLRNKKQLFVNIDAPLITSPSFKEEITVSVIDYKKRPVKNADVSVVSTNAKFEEYTKPAIFAPYRSRFNLKKKRFWNDIDLDSDMNNLTGLYDYQHCKTRFGLDSIVYYDFLFPQKEGFRYSLSYDSILTKMKNEFEKVNGIEYKTDKVISQFEKEHNPRKGGLLIRFIDTNYNINISWIKVDDSLAFYAGEQTRNDHFIDLSEGIHKLEIRTEYHKIIVDSISIPKNHETILSFDLNNLPSYIHTENINREYSESEKMMLAAHKFILRTKGNSYSNQTAVIKQFGEENIVSSSYRTRNDDNSYFYEWEHSLLHKGKLEFKSLKTNNEIPYTLNFEPFVCYEFDNKKGFTKNYNLPKSYFFPSQKDAVLAKNKGIISNNFAFPFFNYASYGRRESKEYIYTWKTPQLSIRSENWKELIIKNTDSLSENFEKEYTFKNRTAFKGQLPTGNYTIYIIYKEVGCGKIENVQLKENEIVFLDFDKNGIDFSAKEKAAYKVYSPKKRTEKHFDYSSFKIDKNTKMAVYKGIVSDADGMGLPGATVLVRGTTIGTSTDIEGNYSIYAPVGSILVFSYVGYGVEERQTNKFEKTIDVILGENEMLESVVVTSYGVQTSRSSMAYSVQSLSGSVAGISISSSNFLQQNNIDLSLSSTLNLDSEDLETNNSLSSKNTKKVVRNYFTDNAIWQPKLKTNRKGKVRFEATFPDNITSWKTLAVAYGKKFRNGQALTQTNSFLSLSAQLSLPRFLLEGDSVRVIGKINSYSSDSIKTSSFFSLDNQELPKRKQTVLFSHVDSLRFKAKDYSLFSSEFNSDSLGIFRDSLKLSYIMNADLSKKQVYTDGEERKIPIYRKGLLKKRGFFAILEGDTTLDLKIFKDSLSDANPVQVTVQDNILEAMVLELENIQNYAYACNEQKASKIKAYILEKEIKQKLGKPFEKKKQKELEELIKKLVKAQYNDGLWGWWESSAPNVYMTSYIYGVLFEAREKGFDIDSKVLRKAEKAILNDSYIPYYYQKAQMYRSLAVNQNLVLRYKNEVEKLTDSLQITENNREFKSFYTALSIIRLRQIYGLPYSISILRLNQQRTQFGGIFWKEFDYGWRYSYSLFQNNNQITLLAYQILRDAQKDKILKDNEKLPAQLSKVRQYFLESRNQSGYWRNTHESASILSTLLPDFEEEYKEKNDKKENQNIFKTQLFTDKDSEEWKPAKTTSFSKSDLPNSITKKGGLPIFVSLSQEYFEEKPKQKMSDNFRISTSFIQEGKKGTKLDSVYLKAGKKLTLQIQLTVTKESEYVSIEVPIPASCVYGKNPYSMRKNYYYYYRGIETYREEFKHKTAIFCTKMPIGTHTFEIILEPRYSGVFTLNPASVELMYFPSIFGNEKTKKVFVE
ncbi:large extracellular alpha-helical protein [Bernardetia litoralis DSM 6794]|uniref:Large extracellular alpha-helical protein n=1 Tax=Bernardetia litoralis (strain ATCC 23117 / DSM 6794 / NBRC 15988 / NCIMB 1366 / Fx l1 / Sio-4) TaxID=880071 RepID=I4AKV6_BERLS|nr:alpha-2-macroglobulin family protein [Bernardetia litoralis]AFM04591.1 large extracellular alpha-helical protein [Bernardetia litoralis DSM 6794]